MWTDLRLALRQMARRPAYAVTCVVVLAFGLGTATAVFSALYSAVWKPLPYPDPQRLVVVHNRFPGSEMQKMGASPADYQSLTQRHELFAETGAYYFLDLNLTGVDVPRKVNAIAATSSLFDLLGARPLVGRTFSDGEQSYHGPHAVLLSEQYWQSEFGRDPAILSRALQLNGELYPVIGVMPKSFSFPNDVTQMWTPMTLRDPFDARSYFLRMYARLAPGIDFMDASARTAQLRSPASAPPGWRYFLSPMERDADESLRHWLWILFAAVLCFLLIVCSNVAGLVLARSSERRFDLAVRMALGAGRWRIARQVLAEVLLFTGFGCVAGLAVARAGIALLVRYGPGLNAEFEPRVFSFALGLSLLTGMLCGLYPALHAAGAASFTVARRDGRRWQKALIVAQVGIATALLVLGGLLVHSLLRLLDAPPGFDPRNVLTMYVSLPPKRYQEPESRTRFFDAVLEKASAIPGIDSAAACTLMPFGYGENVNTFEIIGSPKPSTAPYADLNTVSAGYFDTMRIPLLRGRAFTAQDRRGSPMVVLIDDAFARLFFANEDPVGRMLKMPFGAYTIAGVVGSVKVSSLDAEPGPTIYFSAEQATPTDMVLALRSRLPLSALVPVLERITTGIDRNQPIYDVAPLAQRIEHSIRERRFVVWLMTIFAGAGTGLAALGLYGLLSYLVVLRRREIGIRMALGAGRDDVALLIFRDAMAMVAAGLLLGSGAALAAYRWIASQMYGVGIGDAATWIVVITAVCMAGLAAGSLPAWRMTRVNPAEALRAQ